MARGKRTRPLLVAVAATALAATALLASCVSGDPPLFPAYDAAGPQGFDSGGPRPDGEGPVPIDGGGIVDGAPAEGGLDAGDVGDAGGEAGFTGRAGGAVVTGGVSATSANYKMVTTTGQSPGGNAKMSSPSYQIRAGVAGATGK